MNAQQLYRISFHSGKLPKWAHRRTRLICFFHPALLVVSGYSVVSWPLSPVLKISLFALLCFLSGWGLYKVLMHSYRHNPTSLSTKRNAPNVKRRIEYATLLQQHLAATHAAL